MLCSQVEFFGSFPIVLMGEHGRPCKIQIIFLLKVPAHDWLRTYEAKCHKLLDREQAHPLGCSLLQVMLILAWNLGLAILNSSTLTAQTLHLFDFHGGRS